MSNWYETKNHFWIIYEYLSGESLSELIRQENSMNEEFLRQIVEMLLSGLYYLHAQRVVFFNFTSRKMCFDEYGILKFVDFSEAKMIGEKYELPIDNSYIAPELMSCSNKLTIKSDFWGLGCLIFELVTGKPPFEVNSSYESFEQKYSFDHKKLDKYSEELSSLIKSLLQVNVDKRAGWKDVFASSWCRGFKIKKATSFSQLNIDKNHSFDSTSDKMIESSHSEASKDNENEQITDNLSLKEISFQEVFNLDSKTCETKHENKSISQTKMTSTKVIKFLDTYIEPKKDQFYDNSSNMEKIIDLKTTLQIFEPESEYKIRKTEQSKLNFSAESSEEANNYSIFQKEQKNLLKKEFKISLEKSKELLSLLRETSATPIIFNKDIEIIDIPTFKSFSNDFPLLDVSCFNEEEIRKYLTLIFKFLSSDPSVEKCLPLFYHLVKISSIGPIANFISGSVLLTSICKSLNSNQSKQLKIVLCILIGSIFRYTTSANLDLNENEVAVILLRALQEFDLKVSQHASAALGELLFYSASKSTDQSGSWDISADVFRGTIELLKNNKNEIILSYLIKSIENISSSLPKIGLLFSTEEFVSVLFQIVIMHKSIYLKTISLRTLYNIVDINHELKNFLHINHRFADKLLGISFSQDIEFSKAKTAFLCVLFVDLSEEYSLEKFELIARFSKDLVLFYGSEVEALKLYSALLISILITKNVKFFELFINIDSFFQLIENSWEKMSVQKSTLSSHFISVFVLLLDALKNNSKLLISMFLYMFSVPKIYVSGFSREISNFIQVIYQITRSQLVLRLTIDPENLKGFLTAIDRIIIFFDLEIESQFEFFLKILKRIVGLDELDQNLQQIIFVNIIGKTQSLVESEQSHSITNLMFDVLVSLLMSIQILSEKSSFLIAGFVKKLTSKMSAQNLEMKLTAMKLMRYFFDKELFKPKMVSILDFINSLSSQLQDLSIHLVNKNYFALLFYSLVEDSFSLIKLQQDQIFERAVIFLLSHENCSQFEEILGFLNIFAEILYKLIKKQQLSNKVQLDGDSIDQLLSHLNQLSFKISPMYYEDLINIHYYLVGIIVKGSPHQLLKIIPECRLKLQHFDFLPYFLQKNVSTSCSKKIQKLLIFAKSLKRNYYD